MIGSNYYGYPLNAKRTPKKATPPTPPPIEDQDHLEEKFPARRRSVFGDVMKTFRGNVLLKVEKRRSPKKIQKSSESDHSYAKAYGKVSTTTPTATPKKTPYDKPTPKKAVK